MVAVVLGAKHTFGILLENRRMVETVLHFLSCLGYLWLSSV